MSDKVNVSKTVGFAGSVDGRYGLGLCEHLPAVLRKMPGDIANFYRSVWEIFILCRGRNRIADQQKVLQSRLLGAPVKPGEQQDRICIGDGYVFNPVVKSVTIWCK